MKRLIALVLTVIMLLGALPMGVFAAETATGLVYENEIYTDTELAKYKQYETMWTDSKYVKGDVKISVYIDMENATDVLDTIIYVVNWNDEGIGRIGKDSDTAIVKDLILAEASAETKRTAAVVVVDFGGNELSVAGNIEKSLAVLRYNLTGKEALTIWADPAAEAKTTTTYPVHSSVVYVLPAGYRILRDVTYYKTDEHAALGTFKSIIYAWNSHIAYNLENKGLNPSSYGDTDMVEDIYKASVRLPKAVEYAWHTADDSCTFPHDEYPEVECYYGAPQEIDGEVVKYTKTITHTGDKATCEYPHDILKKASCTKNSTANVNWAPVVDRVEDCRKPDGSPLDYNCRLDIIYPSGDEVAETPVFVMSATHSHRMDNVGTIKDVTGAHNQLRCSFVGFTFSGYTGAVYDYTYIPMARDDHYSYIDPYDTHWSNAAKSSRAAIRCIRYYAEQFGYSSELIGVAGISKGTPSVGVLSTIDNKYVKEQGSPSYEIDGESVLTRDAGYYEGDLNDDGTLTKGKTVQPFLSYDQGYDGEVAYDEDGNIINEISSEISVAYCAAGGGIDWTYKGNDTVKVGAISSVTGKETQHVPMILSCGLSDQYGCWDNWPHIQDRFTNYSKNPFIAISMEDLGHDYPAGIDPMRDYDRYDAYMQFFHSILKPDLYTAQVAYVLPVDGTEGVDINGQVQVQLIKPAETLAAFSAAASVKDQYGNAVAGTWTTNATNTSGLYTFTPTEGYMGGISYTVTVDSPVVEAKTQKSFTTMNVGALRPVADTYVSAADVNGVYGKADVLYIDNQRTYLASFAAADINGANRAFLNLPIAGEGSQTVKVYLVDNYKVDEDTTCYNNAPKAADGVLIGEYTVSEGNSTIDLLGMTGYIEGEYFTILVTGSALVYIQDFETVTSVSTSSNNVTDGDYTHYYGHHNSSGFRVRNGGGLKARKIETVSGNNVFYTKTLEDASEIYGGYSKIYNALYDNVNVMVDELAGKKFKYSVDATFVSDLIEGGTAPSVTVGFIRSGENTWLGTKQQATFTEKGQSVTLTGSYTVPATEIKRVLTISGAKRYSYPMFCLYAEDEFSGAKSSPKTGGSNYYEYHFDNIIIEEVAPSAVASRENTETMTAYIVTTTRPEGAALADTYVSNVYPDMAFGNSDKLLLSGGNVENIIFATYSASLIEGNPRTIVDLPATNGASIDAEIFLLDGYFVEEGKLTYNNMPSLTDAVSLGVYEIGKDGRIDIASLCDRVEGIYFTLAFVSKDEGYGYYNNFEQYNVNQVFEDGNGKDNSIDPTRDNNVFDEAEENALHYYQFTDSNRDVKYTLGRRNGHLGRKVVEIDGNKVLRASTISSTTESYSGHLKIYNTVLDRFITEEDIGRSFKFTAVVKASDDTTATDTSKLKVTARAILTVGTDNAEKIYEAGKMDVTSTALLDGWTKITATYTIKASDIKVAKTSNDRRVYAYPTFELEFHDDGKTTLQNIYLADDFRVVELNADGTEMAAEFASSESGKSTITLKGRDYSEPIADTFVSAFDIAVETKDGQNAPASDKDTVYGDSGELYVSGKNSYIGERVALISYSSEALLGGDTLVLNLPVVNDSGAKVNVYVLADYVVDEKTVNYNTYTAEIKNEMVLAASDVSLRGGNNMVSLGDVELGDFFTVVITAAEDIEHIYVADFERWEAGTHGYSGNKNELYTSYFYDVNSTAYTESDYIGYSQNHFYVRGSNPTKYYLSVLADPADATNNVLECIVKANGPRLKLVNTTTFKPFTEDDIGDVYRATIRIKAIADDGAVYSLSPQFGMFRISGDKYEVNSLATSSTNLNGTSIPMTSNGEWYEFTYDYKLDANDIVSNVTGHTYNDPVFAIDLAKVSDTVTVCYYIDDIQVVKLEDGKEPVVVLNALENADRDAALPTVGRINSKGAVADTYVSMVNPDKAHGSEDKLLLGDANGDKTAMVLSFKSEVLDADKYLVLELPELSDEVKDVNVYLVPNYLADEATLTWNTMPEYEDCLVGVYDFVKGDNRIDLSSVANNLEGEFFTLVLGTEGYCYANDFEDYATGKLSTAANDVKIDGITYRYGFSDTVTVYRGGSISESYIVKDGDEKAVTAYTSAGEAYSGRLKFTNSIPDLNIAAGKTYRFTVRVKAYDELSASNSKVALGVFPSYGSYPYGFYPGRKEADQLLGEYVTVGADGWTTISYDYVVNEAHFAATSYESGGAVNANTLSYPMFGIEVYDRSSTEGYKYRIGEVAVTELGNGASISSREANGGACFVSALDGAVSSIEVEVSAADSGAVIGITDNDSTYTLLSVEDGKLVFDGKTLLNASGSEITLGSNSVKAIAIYDDVKGTVRFAVGNNFAYYLDGEELKVTYDLAAIDGGVSERAKISASGWKASRFESTLPKIIGDQINEVGNAVRFVAGVDGLVYNSVGFKIEYSGVAGDKGSSSKQVFSQITADGKPVYAFEYGYDFMSVIEIRNITSGGVIKVTPYFTIGDLNVEGNALYYSIIFDGKVIRLDTVDASEFVEAEA